MSATPSDIGLDITVHKVPLPYRGGEYREVRFQDSRDTESVNAWTNLLSPRECYEFAARLREVADELIAGLPPLGKTRAELDEGFKAFTAGLVADVKAMKGAT